MVQVCRGLDRDRFQPLVTCLKPGGPLADKLIRFGVPYEETPVWSGLGPPGRAAVNSVRRFRPDVVHVQTKPDKLWGRLAAVRGRAPLLVSAARYSKPSWHDRFLLNRVSAVIANCDHRKAAFSRDFNFPADRVFSLPNGVEADRLLPPDQPTRDRYRAELGLTSGDLVAVQAARFHPVKDQPTALKALAKVRSSRPEAKLILVGQGGTEPSLRRLTARLGLTEAVVFAPPRPDPYPYYAAADIGLLSSRGEGLPRVLVEAAACGLPLAATDVGGCREIARPDQTGLIVPPGDPTALAEAWSRLADRPELRRSLGRAGRKLVEAEYTSAKMINDFQEIIERLVAENRVAADNRGV